jgi:hypothetical protein
MIHLGAAAAEVDGPQRTPALITQALAKDAAFSSALVHAGDAGSGFAVATTAFNTVQDKAAVDVTGEVHLVGRFSLVLGVANALSSSARPRVGGAVKLLDEAHHGVDSTGYLFYKAEGFAEPEGEIEAIASFGRSFGLLRAVANVAYGQDPEARERDGEVALGLQVSPTEKVTTGVLGRYRDALGSGGDAGVIRDVFGGASATLAVGRFAVSGLAGVTGIETKTSGTLTTGLSAAMTVGAAF